MHNRTTDVAEYFVTGKDWNDAPRYFSVAVLIAIDTLAIVLNSLVIWIIIRDRELRNKPDSLLIANLAFSDLLVSATIIPFSIDTLIRKEARFSQSTAVFIGFGNFTFCIASIMTLMVLVIDQTLIIKWPFRYEEYRTRKTAVYAMIYTWAHSISCALPPMFGLGSYSCFIINTGPCTTYQWVGTKGSILFTIIVTLSSWGLALVVTLVCYAQIGVIAVKQKSKVTKEHLRLSRVERNTQRNKENPVVGSPTSAIYSISMSESLKRPQNTRKTTAWVPTINHLGISESQESAESYKVSGGRSKNSRNKLEAKSRTIAHFRHYSMILKPALTLLFIIVTYFCTWSPFCILLLVEIAEQRKAYSEMSLIFLWIGHCSSLLNPIIYFLRYSRFRNALCRYRRKVRACTPIVIKRSKNHSRRTNDSAA